MSILHFDATLSDNQFGLPDPVVTKQGTGATGLEYQIVGTTVQTLCLRAFVARHAVIMNWGLTGLIKS